MNRGLKNELAFLCGTLALLSLRGKSKAPAVLLGGTAAALLLYNQRADSFVGQSVVVTGGSRGLGLALGRELVREGALVALIARDIDELEIARKQILELYPDGHVLALPCDVTDSEQVEAAFRRVRAQFGGIDMLINNAGAITVGPYDQMNKQDFEAQLELHFYAVMNAVNTALPYLRRSAGRRIVNICSMGGKVAVPHMLPYDVSKFALAGYTQGLAAELSSENISVTGVYPALMRTGSPIQAVFKGDQEKEFAWFASADILPGLSTSAQAMAAKVIESARRRDNELIPSLPAKLRMVGGSLFPELVARVMSLLAGLMPQGQSLEHKTGAQSRTLFDKSPWTVPFRQASHMIEEGLNQKPKYDAEFNMGLKKLH